VKQFLLNYPTVTLTLAQLRYQGQTDGQLTKPTKRVYPALPQMCSATKNNRCTRPRGLCALQIKHHGMLHGWYLWHRFQPSPGIQTQL